jgi:hypothetical protein
MALSKSALSDLLDALRAGGDLDVIREGLAVNAFAHPLGRPGSKVGGLGFWRTVQPEHAGDRAGGQ